MRKSMGVFMGLLVILISVSAVSFAAVNKTGYEIEIDEEVLYGDKSVAEGLVLEIPVSMNFRLFWETFYTVGEQHTPQTEVWLKPMGYHEPEEGNGNRFTLEMNSGEGSTTTGNMELDVRAPYGMEIPFMEVAERTASGESHTERVRYRDYREYYPFIASVVIDFQECVGEDRDSRAEQDAFLGEIKIPIPEDCYIDITIHKNEDGGVYGYDYNMIDGRLARLGTFHVVTDDAMYYVVDARHLAEGGIEVPVEGMEDWYGIYKMKYRIVQNGDFEVVEPDLNNIGRVIPLDTDVRLLDMRTSEDGSKMLLFTAEQDVSYLNVIDFETLETVQRIELFPAADEVVSSEVINKDGFLVWIAKNYLMASDYRMAVLTESEAGRYELKFTGALWPEEVREELGSLHTSLREIAVDYDGEKLAIIYPQPYYYRHERQNEKGTCLFWLMVYDESGMLYLGEYAASQGIGEDYGSVYCNIRDDVMMGVNWGE